jgi:hypothetical protein
MRTQDEKEVIKVEKEGGRMKIVYLIFGRGPVR